MTALNLTATDNRQKTVLEHLIPLVSDTLAEKINSGVIIEKDGKRLINKKDLSTFMTYATEEAKKMLSDKEHKGAQAVCVHGDDIMSWAIHYFEEDSIEGKLYNEDGTEYVPPKPVYKPKSTPTVATYTPSKPKPEPQLSMFDLLGEQKKDEPAPVEITDQPNDHEPAEEEEEPTEEELAEAMEQEKQPPIPPVTKQPSPLYQHYLNIQNHYSDAIVALRVGDFYEVFGNNAITVANELDLTLTGRDCGLEDRVPMVGFPFHAADSYVDKLTARGYKVAIAEDIKTNNVTVKEPELRVDEETGEVLSVEEMRKYDGDIEEADVPTVTKIVSSLGEQKTSLGTKSDDLKQAGQILQTFDETSDEDDDFPPIDTKAYDLEALSILDALFGSTMILR